LGVASADSPDNDFPGRGRSHMEAIPELWEEAKKRKGVEKKEKEEEEKEMKKKKAKKRFVDRGVTITKRRPISQCLESDADDVCRCRCELREGGCLHSHFIQRFGLQLALEPGKVHVCCRQRSLSRVGGISSHNLASHQHKPLLRAQICTVNTHKLIGMRN
jgi:hypothetical protein